MPDRPAQLPVGLAVWVRTGSSGWSPARVVSVGRKFVHLQCVKLTRDGEKPGRNAKRLPTSLAMREPKLAGRDKPTVEEAIQVQAEEGRSVPHA